MTFLTVIRQVSSKKAHINRTFTELQVIRCIQTLGEKKILGRTLLSRFLKTGPGAIRTLIGDLERSKIVYIEKSGCKLTKKGISIYKQITKKIPVITKIDAGRLSVAEFDAVALVKNASNNIYLGIEQRDAAVKVGAIGATTLIFKEDRFEVPLGSKDCAKDFSDDIWHRLKKILKPHENDVIIVSSASDVDIAIYGALAGALTLLE